MRDDMGHEAAPPVMVVDLDGTLIRSDMLDESFWAAVSQDWRVPLRALAGLSRGKAALKAQLGALALPDPATLPYRPEVLEMIARHRAAGGRVVLATAADAAAAQAVADHLGVFDAVHASDGAQNLRGSAKAALLTARYGAGGFVYLGDSAADLPVWAAAGGAVTVGARAEVHLDLHDWDGTNAWHRPFIPHADVVQLSDVALADPEPVIAELLSGRARQVVLTRAERGAEIITARERIAIPPVEARLVDSNGAGDAFAVALWHGQAKGWPPDRAGRFAAAAAAFSVEDDALWPARLTEAAILARAGLPA